MTSSTLSGSNRGTRVNSPPARNVVFMSEFMPNTWNNGSMATATDSRTCVDQVAGHLGTGAEVAVRAAPRPWVRPVVPDV